MSNKSKVVENKSSNKSPKPDVSFNSNKNTKGFLFTLIAVCLFYYSNTLYNSYCLDDSMVITENSSTQKGFSGIKEHINQDLLFGFKHIKSKSASSAGWRPLSLITYSAEVGLWGKNKPGMSHLVNMILYALLVCVIFIFFSNYLLKDIWLSFLAAFLFAIHPVHTEVVANIKSRDEILCLLFMILSLIQLWKYFESKKNRQLFSALILFFISLTAKENSFTFIAGVPVMLYFFTDFSRKKIISVSALFAVTGIFYLIIRNAFVPLLNVVPNPEIINNAFLYATGLQGICTKIYLLLIYFRLLVFPFPLCFDYSYNQIPYSNISSPAVWISVAILILLIVFAIRGLKRKDILSFCIIMFFITFSISSNFIFEIGTMIGERFLFMPSLFFCIALAKPGMQLVTFISSKMHLQKTVAVAILLLPVFTAGAVITISRNSDWTNDYTLGLADISKSPNSSRVNNAAGASCLFYSFDQSAPAITKDSLLKVSVIYFKKSLQIFPEYNDAELNLGLAYNQMDSIDNAEKCWDIVRVRTPNHPRLKIYDNYLGNHFITAGLESGKRNSLDSALYFFNKATVYSDRNDSLKLSCYYNLGGVYFTMGNYKMAHESFGKVMDINPDYLNSKQGYLQSESLMKNGK